METNQVAAQARKELDEEILFYVREMQNTAPVTDESICGFCRDTRRRNVSLQQIQDRLAYLSAQDVGYLKKNVEWNAGEFVHYTITGEGMDLLDGAAPPRQWKASR